MKLLTAELNVKRRKANLASQQQRKDRKFRDSTLPMLQGSSSGNDDESSLSLGEKRIIHNQDFLSVDTGSTNVRKDMY